MDGMGNDHVRNLICDVIYLGDVCLELKDFGYIKIGQKNIHITSEEDVPEEEIFSAMFGMMVGNMMYDDEKGKGAV